MRKIQTEILVIGGGATGCGVLRDLAMRGFKTALVERRDLSHGTSGRYHGLLHSGGRYVVKDPQAAKECIEENQILRRIMPHCIEDTGGFFVVTPWDDPAYGPRFAAGCKQAGIPVEEVPIAEMLRAEPLLNPQISACFRVPDASADSFLAAECNTASARQYGAQVFPYYEVRRLLRNGERIQGAICYDLVKDEEVQFDADLVVNAAGAWAGKIAASANLVVQIKPGKGTMIAINHRVVNTVINRCKMPADGDIIVPAHTVAVIGTTDEQVADPDHFAIEPWEIELMLREGEKLIPGMRQMRLLRAWAGVRPLYQETQAAASRDITRAYVLLDHTQRDGVDGLVTITSGKWTTYRKMAESTVDRVCEKLKTQRACHTAEEVLPALGHGPAPEGSGRRSGAAPHFHYLGARLAEIEKQRSYGQLLCECELATEAEVEQAILKHEARSIDDIRRETRLGMGPCQGGFCTVRAAGLWQRLRQSAVTETNATLRDFLQERWKGLLPILWGQQLRQERLDELIYQNVLNVEALPGPQNTRLGSENYAQAALAPSPAADSEGREPRSQAGPENVAAERTSNEPIIPVLVIGAGLAGLSAAWQATQAGCKTRLIAKGWGATHWASGCIDVLGKSTASPAEWIRDGLDRELKALIEHQPQHPYATAGLEQLETALNAFQALCAAAGYPLHGSLERNWLLPTVVGSFRPTCLAPQSMLAGDVRSPAPMLLVGFKGFLDFYPELAAANLNAQEIRSQSVTLELPELARRRFITGRVLAELFDTPAFRQAVIQALRPRLPATGANLRVGFPAVLGLRHAAQVQQELEAGLGCQVFEMPGLPPSIPGIRLHRLLVQAIENQGGRVFDGMQVLAGNLPASPQEPITVWSEAAARRKAHRATSVVLATGGLLGGGFYAGDASHLEETIFHLPLSAALGPVWFQSEFNSSGGHPVYQVGLATGQDFRSPAAANLFCAGGLLNGDALQQRSMEGIALLSGFTAGRAAALQAQSMINPATFSVA